MTSIAPERSCSSRTMRLILFSTLRPSGSQEKLPAACWRMRPARSISRCETISASRGVSRRVGMK